MYLRENRHFFHSPRVVTVDSKYDIFPLKYIFYIMTYGNKRTLIVKEISISVSIV